MADVRGYFQVAYKVWIGFAETHYQKLAEIVMSSPENH